VGYNLSVVPQNQWVDEDGMRHALRSSGLLRLEVSRASVSQLASKLVKERWQVMHVASSQRSHRNEAKDGWFDGIICGAVESDQNTL
jgi:hypothetical protein